MVYPYPKMKHHEIHKHVPQIFFPGWHDTEELSLCLPELIENPWRACVSVIKAVPLTFDCMTPCTESRRRSASFLQQRCQGRLRYWLRELGTLETHAKQRGTGTICERMKNPTKIGASTPLLSLLLSPCRIGETLVQAATAGGRQIVFHS